MRVERQAADKRRLWGALALGLLGWSGTSLAPAEPAPSVSSVTVEGDPARDCRLTYRARQALFQEPGLATVTNLGVSVRSGVATLWGGVPSADLSLRAETLLRQIQGIFEVRNELHVEPPHDAMVEFLRTPVPRRLSGGAERSWFLANRLSVPLIPVVEPETPLVSPVNGVTLLPPVGASSPQAITIPVDLTAAIKRLQEADARFRGIQPDVQQGVVRLRGTVDHWEDAFELAHRVSRVTGVERVILLDIRTPSAKPQTRLPSR
jgi:osmotically-inducible protein OsmY